jgi:hypothetical protein
MNEFVHSADPPRRPRARAILSPTVSPVSPVSPVSRVGRGRHGAVFTGTADVASTWGASAAEKSRCFGAAVGTYKFSASTCMSVLNREFNSVVAERGRSPPVPVVHLGQPRRFVDATPGDGVEPVRPLRQRDVLGPGVDPGL